jgi:hypothetical protein
MLKFASVLTAIAVVLMSGATVFSGERKALTLSCLEVPQLCNCQFPVCAWSTTRAQAIGDNRFLYDFGGDLTKGRCSDLAYNVCKRLGCRDCKDK